MLSSSENYPQEEDGHFIQIVSDYHDNVACQIKTVYFPSFRAVAIVFYDFNFSKNKLFHNAKLLRTIDQSDS